MSAKVTLKIVKGVLKGQEFTFDEHDTFIFGREEDCHVSLSDKDKQVSRHHFILEVNPPDARIRDLGSLNGTYINATKYGGREKHETPEEGARRQYPQVDLRDGDEIRVGETVLRVEVPTKVLGTVRCQRCGKNVSGEAGAARSGDYVCESCRTELQTNPAEVIAALLEQAGQQFQADFNIPDYDIEKKLGEGGMGAAYLVKHKQTGHRVALKVMLSKVAVDEDSRQRFLLEAKITAALQHKNIVKFLGQGSTGSFFYFLLEFCQGGSIASLIERRGGRLSLQEAAPLMLQALEGLAYAHGQGFVHRDLKPQNILLAGKEGEWVVKVADMGLAKSFEQSGFSGHTATGSYAGTYPFMPREQVTNFKLFKPTGDVWAIGATFYNMLTSEFPRDFQRGQDPIDIILHKEIVPIARRDPRIPTRVADVIDCSLANKPDERYQNAGEMLRALEKAL